MTMKKCPSCGGKGYKLTKTHKVAYTCGECGGSGEVEDVAPEKERMVCVFDKDTICIAPLSACKGCEYEKSSAADEKKPSEADEERGYEIAKLAAEENGISVREQLRLNAECEKIFKDVDFSSLRPYKPKKVKPSVEEWNGFKVTDARTKEKSVVGEEDDYKLGLEHADREWKGMIEARIQELEASLDAINKSLNESWEQKPISVYVISELEKQYRERYYVLEVLRGLLEKKEVKTDG